jgi:hypothetical protein
MGLVSARMDEEWPNIYCGRVGEALGVDRSRREEEEAGATNEAKAKCATAEEDGHSWDSYR